MLLFISEPLSVVTDFVLMFQVFQADYVTDVELLFFEIKLRELSE